MKRILGGLLVAVAVLGAIVVARTVSLAAVPKAPPATDLVAVDADAAAEHLAGAIRIPTVTRAERDQVDWPQFSRLHEYLATTFPRAHAALAHEVVSRYSLLYTWRGTDAAAPPILLLAHQDVVPVEPGTEGAWAHPPFSGAIADGFVWGRGAIDDKGSLVAQLEAVEQLLAHGFAPRRTVYFCFGHDEEIGGDEGATALAAVLAERNVHAEFSLDEGGTITRGVVAGIDGWIASVMTAEKGYLSLRLAAHDAGGHSSRPPQVSAIGRLARAVARLEAHPLPARLGPPVTDMLDRLAPGMDGTLKVAMANRWLFGALIERRLLATPTTAALLRTTTAPTLFHAGIKDNVLPSEASATVNFRIVPGETMLTVEAHARGLVDDPEVVIERVGFASDPSPVSASTTKAFAVIERTVNEVYPDALVAPGLVIGATDNRRYGAVRDTRYNFSPARLTKEDLVRVHGTNERIGVDDHARAVQFYARLLEDAAR
jgi:carboxypeptidase PM20D1